MIPSNPAYLIGILAFHQWREQWRSRAFLATLVFAAVMLYAGAVLSLLAVDQQTQALLDFGQSLIELTGLVLVSYGAAVGMLREIQTRSADLILTRPIPRWIFLLGRTLGLLLAVFSSVALMSAAHLFLLVKRGWAWQPEYLIGILGACLKLSIACALTTLLALATSSIFSALFLSGIVWVLGHFMPEILSMAQRSARTVVALFLTATAYILPNLGLLNFRDRLSLPSLADPSGPILLAVAYTAVYSAACMVFSYAFLRKKEF